MFKNFLKYISVCLAFGLSLSSCADDVLDGGAGKGEMKEYRGTLTFDLSTPDLTVSTRTLDTEPGAQVRINNLWVGVFNTATGECFGSAKYDNLNQTLQSGVLFRKLIEVDFIAYSDVIPLAYVVAVANYDGVTTCEGLSLDDILPASDRHNDIDWDRVVNLDIDTRTAYAGDKGEDENANAPFLAGFYQDAVSLTQNPKIDQFAYGEAGPSALYPEAAASGMDIKLGDDDGANNIYVAAGAICLRRLVSHNTVNINASNGFQVTSLRYKRFNMPQAVYMLQRRTDTNRYGSFGEWSKNSPNRADQLLEEGEYGAYGTGYPYDSDEDWNYVDMNSWEDNGAVSFAYDHFENKHWGFGSLKDQNDREALNPDGTFSALCSGSGDAYNNFASYIVIGMHIVNKATGEGADVEYRVHEGFCNNDDGRRTTAMEEKCRDFSSYRNVNYTYNINVSGVNDILLSVTGEEGHPNGQNGSIWKMNYATGPSRIPIPIGGGAYGGFMSFGANPDLGFRIVGRDAAGTAVDVCYNMPAGMNEGFSGLWAAGSPTSVSSIAQAGAVIPSSLLNEMRVSVGARLLTVLEFIEGIGNGTLSPSDSYGVTFSSYDGSALAANYIRGLYIFDLNDSRNADDADGCSSVRMAYGAEQYPFELEKLTFPRDNVLWDKDYYPLVSPCKNVFSASTPIFYGAEGSIIDLRWIHDVRFIGYRISIYNDKYTHPTVVIGPDRLSDYLTTVGGKTVFIYPLDTASFPRSTGTGANNYHFAVTPIVDKEMYEVGEPTVFTNNMNGDDATCIRVCPTIWDISSSNDWKTVMVGGLSDADIHYRGLQLMMTTAVESKYGVKGSYICFGGSGNIDSRHFRFVATVPGKIAVTCRSHSGSADASRQLIIARMNDDGSMKDAAGARYDEVYKSGAMAGSSTTYTSDVLPLYNGRPTEFRIYAGGSIDYYKIQFIPSN